MRPGSFPWQIPARYLTPRRQAGGGVVCEPAILVKRRGSAATIRQQVSRGLHRDFHLVLVSVGDPEDPHVFGPPGSGSTSQLYGSGFGSFPFLIKVLSGLK
jgi:hypothetical protein